MFVMFQTRGRYRAVTLALAAVVTTALTVAVAVAMLIAGAVVVAALFLARAVLPRSWWHRRAFTATPWPGKTIDTTIVTEEAQPRVRSASRLRR